MPTVCSASGRCVVTKDVYVDWVLDCRIDGTVALTIGGLVPGSYLVTGLPSGGTVWDGPWTPPTTGWYWYIPCDNLSPATVRTPAGAYYDSAETAFASLMEREAIVTFDGPDLLCAKRDSNCADNHGGTEFRMELVCP